MVTTLFDKGLSLFGAQITHPVRRVEVIDSAGKARRTTEVAQLSGTFWGGDLKRFLMGTARGLTANTSARTGVITVVIAVVVTVVVTVVITVVKTVGRTGRSTG